MQKPKLRVLGTSTTLHAALRRRAEEDLEFEIKFIVADGGSVQRRAVLEPESFDVYDQWFESVELVWPANALQPIDTAKLRYWDDVNELAKTGRFGAEFSNSEGCSPQRHLYVTKDGDFMDEPSRFLTMLPLTHNADSFAYVPDNLTEDNSVYRESWAWLIDERWKGKVALQNDAAIGAIDAALAVQSAGLGQFKDLGNLSVTEIDHLVKILIDRKGEVCDGGSYQERMSRIAVWNSVMDEHNYLVRRWNEFLAA
jgi:putative spermidine/putrescine transport system substrate-binding protein